MDLIRNCFYDSYDNEFFDYVGTFERQFEKEVPELKKLSMKEEKVLDQYPHLRSIIDDKKFTLLDESDIRGLLKFIDIREDRLVLIKELMFYKGYKEAYYFFKKIGLLKESKE